MQDLADASAKTANRTKALITISSQNRSLPGGQTKPAKRSQSCQRAWALIILGQKQEWKVKIKGENKAAHTILGDIFKGDQKFCPPFLMVSCLHWEAKSGAPTTGNVNDTCGSSCSRLFHSLWTVEAASQMLPKSLASVLARLYISWGCKRNRLQINHNEQALSTVGGNKGNPCTIIRWEAQVQPLESNSFYFTELEKLFFLTASTRIGIKSWIFSSSYEK